MSALSGLRHVAGFGQRGRRGVLVPAVAALAAMSVLAASALCAAQAQALPVCAIHSSPSFVEDTTNASVADVVEVECEAALAGDTVELEAPPLCSKYGGSVTWSSPYPYAPTTGETTTVKLTGAGNATVALWGGPNCAAGTYVIIARLQAPPYNNFWAELEVQGPQIQSPGISAHPGTQTEDKVHGSVATVVEVSFNPYEYGSGQPVAIRAPELYETCSGAPHLEWFGPDANKLSGGAEEVRSVKDTEGC